MRAQRERASANLALACIQKGLGSGGTIPRGDLSAQLPPAPSDPNLAVAKEFEQGSRMRDAHFSGMAVAAIAAPRVALGGSVQAKTCSERLQVCDGYCVKSMAGSPACRAKCRQFHQECTASGCWESRVVAKQCGFVRQ